MQLDEQPSSKPTQAAPKESGEQRQRRFALLCRVILHVEVDLARFAADMLYAMHLIERAAGSESPELRNLAAHLRLELEGEAEVITLRATEPEDQLAATRKLQTLSSQPEGAASQWDGPERRAAAAPRAPDLARILGVLHRLYLLEFGREFDIKEFIANDLYGRAVLQHARTSTNPQLLAAVNRFFDDNGKPRQHRRRVG